MRRYPRHIMRRLRGLFSSPLRRNRAATANDRDAKAWLLENKVALETSTAHVEKHDLPLSGRLRSLRSMKFIPAPLSRILGHWLFSVNVALVLLGLGIEQVVDAPTGTGWSDHRGGLYRGFMLFIAAAHAAITSFEVRFKLGKYREKQCICYWAARFRQRLRY